MLKKFVDLQGLSLILFLSLILMAAQCSPATPLRGQEGQHHDQGHEDLAAHLEDLTPIALAEGESLRVVATTNIVADLVSNVAGEAIDLTSMLPFGVDPHSFTPTPRDIIAVADAHVVFINGLHLEEFLAELIENAGGDAVVVAVSEGIETREFEEIEGHGNRHIHEGADPHTWMTPANAIVMVHNIETVLSTLDPAQAETYTAQAKAYEAELEALDAWVMAQIQAIPEANRYMVTDHDAFGYYADHYGLEIIGTVIPSSSTQAEPSAQELAALLKEIKAVGAKAIFVGTTVKAKLAEQVAQDAGIQLVPLYTGSLGETGSGAETYLDYIRYNTRAIVAALK